MNQLTGADALVKMLQLYDVEYIFGLCGDTSLPFYDSLHRLKHGITHILCRDERSAAYMADGYARVTGKVGICEGPSGGGATYIAPGLIEANESSIAILGITTDISTSGRGKYTLTEVDQESLFRPLTKWNKMIERADELPNLVREAFRKMTTGTPGSAHLGLPFDVQQQPVDDADIWADPTLGMFPSHCQPANKLVLEKCYEMILKAKDPVIICGGGPLLAGAGADLATLSEALQIPVCTSISGKGILSDDHPMSAGVIGSNGGVNETREIIECADLIIFIGCRAGSVTTARWRHPKPGHTKVIHIDSNSKVIGVNYPTDLAIVADARLTIMELNILIQNETPHLPQRRLSAEFIAKKKLDKYRSFHRLAKSNDVPIRPEKIVAELNALLPSDTVIIADPGTPCPYFSAYYHLARSGRYYFSNRAHGALGYSLPAAIGAQYGRPKSKVVSVMGDGSFGFTSGELETAMRLNLPITFIIISNQSFGWIKAGQKNGFGKRYYSVDFSSIDHARIAEAYGVKGWRVDAPEKLRPSLKAALKFDGPTLIDIVSQPLENAKAPVSEWIA